MKGIVVGVDRSPAAQAAAQWALAEGLRRGLPVVAMSTWVDPVTAHTTWSPLLSTRKVPAI